MSAKRKRVGGRLGEKRETANRASLGFRRRSPSRMPAGSRSETQQPVFPSLTAAAPNHDLWIAPKAPLRAPQNIWGMQTTGASDARLLELADIALGMRKPEGFRRRRWLFFSSELNRER